VHSKTASELVVYENQTMKVGRPLASQTPSL